MISTASILLAALVAVGEVSAHGIVSQIKFGSVIADAWNPYSDSYAQPKKEKFTREFNANGPILATDAAILCNTNGGTANVPTSVTQAGVTAGDEMTFFWTLWPDSHKGPTMTYMADCNSDCSTFEATGDVWFKIDESGLNDGVWASDTLIANNNTYTTKIPATIAPGQYLIRHELVALHEGYRAGGAQFYPSCHQVDVASSGTLKPTELVAFPGAYSDADPGITVDIYNNLASYTIPGPAVIEGGTSGGGAAPGGPTGGDSNGGSSASSNGSSSAPSNGGSSASSSGSSGANASSTGGANASSTGANASSTGGANASSNGGASASSTGGASASSTGGSGASSTGGARPSSTGGASASSSRGASAPSSGGESASSSGGASASSVQSSAAAKPTGDASASSSATASYNNFYNGPISGTDATASSSDNSAIPTSSATASSGSNASSGASGSSAKPSGSCVPRRKARRQLSRTGARL